MVSVVVSGWYDNISTIYSGGGVASPSFLLLLLVLDSLLAVVHLWVLLDPGGELASCPACLVAVVELP